MLNPLPSRLNLAAAPCPWGSRLFQLSYLLAFRTLFLCLLNSTLWLGLNSPNQSHPTFSLGELCLLTFLGVDSWTDQGSLCLQGRYRGWTPKSCPWLLIAPPQFLLFGNATPTVLVSTSQALLAGPSELQSRFHPLVSAFRCNLWSNLSAFQRDMKTVTCWGRFALDSIQARVVSFRGDYRHPSTL